MSSINIFGKLLGNVNQFKKFILTSISDNINKSLFSKINLVEKDISKIVIQSIRNQPEYSSLKSGILRNQLGIKNPTVIDSILAELDDIQVQIVKPSVRGDNIEAKVVINMIKDNYIDILSADGSSYMSEKGSQIDWLRWLLLEGNNSVIIGYRYMPISGPSSRTGKGIMAKWKSGMFRVPPVFAGTAENNWITRGLDAALPEVESYFNNIVKKSL